MNQTVPPQSLMARVSFPGITKASRDLRVSRGHLWAVLSGERTSHSLTAKWKTWLSKNPEFARLQHD